MKDHLSELLTDALSKLRADGHLPADLEPAITIERTRDRSHGDFASNLAMVLAKAARSKPRDLAGLIVAALPDSSLVTRIDIAGPGFISFFVS